MKPKLVNSSIISKNQLTWKVLKVDFAHVSPKNLEFRPGQFVNVTVGDEKYRAYSIYSDYKITDKLSIVVENAHRGLGSDFFNNAAVGDQISFVGPSGKLKLMEPYADSLVFFATGTGVSPFISMFYKLVDDGYEGLVKVFVGVREERDVFFEDLLRDFKKKLPGFEYQVYVSNPTKPIKDKDAKETAKKFTKGRITQVVTAVLDKVTHYYLCGNPNMVKDITEILLENEISEENILREEFSWAAH